MHYFIALYYIILHLTFILLLIYNFFKDNNGKVKLDRSRLATRKFWEIGLWERLMVEVATPSKVCFPLIYIFFEVMLMSGIHKIRGSLEDYILFFFLDVCLSVCLYVCLSVCTYVCMYVCMYVCGYRVAMLTMRSHRAAAREKKNAHCERTHLPRGFLSLWEQ